MSDKFTFSSAGEIQGVEFAFARNGWTHALVNKATGGNFFGLIREVLEGRAEVCRIEWLTAELGKIVSPANFHVIDCDAKPFEPVGLTVAPESEQIASRVRGRLVFDPSKVKLYLSEKQQGEKDNGKYIGKYIIGNELKKELSSKPVLPANVLDFYIHNPHLISEECKGKKIFFWGTIYRDSVGRLCVRCLFFSQDRLCSSYLWLDGGWYDGNPAALFAS